MSNKTASKWVDGDSSRKMTNKYNDVVDIVNETSKSTGEINEKTQKELNKINEELSKKIESVSKDDIGLGNVDNTSDMNKPVSAAQSKAIERAVEDQITSELTSELEEDTGFVATIKVNGTTLILGK